MHSKAELVFRNLQLFKEISEYDSRLLELVNYFGWEIGHKAHFCRAFYFDEYEKTKYEKAKEKLGVTDMQYRIMHQYAYFNRLSPDRNDVFHIYDYILDKIAKLENNKDLQIVDFGCGLGQIGLAFSLGGYRVLFVDIVSEFINFAKYLCESRNVTNAEFVIENGESNFKFMDNQNSLIIEWSAFEHIRDPLGQLMEFNRSLVSGGMILTTSLKKDWNEDLVEHYKKDGGNDIMDRLNSEEINEFIDRNFEVISFEKSIGKLLIKK